MKKFLALTMTLLLIATFLTAMSVPASAYGFTFVEETYRYEDIDSLEFGEHSVLKDGTLTEAPIFGDGRWTYEWLDVPSGIFRPMEAYFSEAHAGWAHSGWTDFYTATVESAWVKSGNTYCSIRPERMHMSSGFLSNGDGTRMSPGDTAGACITFVVPVSGNISFEGSLYPYGMHTSDLENSGDALYLYLNDTLVYPANPDDAVFYSDTSSKENPVKIECDSLDVKAGDRVRFVLTTKPGTTNGSKGCYLATAPTVTYRSTADGTPIGNPKGYPPTDIVCEAKPSAFQVSWEEVEKAVGYNVYVDGKKVNHAPVDSTAFLVENLQYDTVYSLSLTALLADGTESDLSPAAFFRTKPSDTDSGIVCCGFPTPQWVVGTPSSVSDSDTAGDLSDVSDLLPADTEDDTATVIPPSASEEASSPRWIILASSVAAVVIVVVVIVLSKKKKAE